MLIDVYLLYTSDKKYITSIHFPVIKGSVDPMGSKFNANQQCETFPTSGQGMVSSFNGSAEMTPRVIVHLLFLVTSSMVHTMVTWVEYISAVLSGNMHYSSLWFAS